MSIRTSQKASRFGESVIREMTRLFLARGDKPGVNLAQGFPDFPAPAEMKDAACRAIQADINQYAITWGAKPLRNAISAPTARFYGVTPDPEREITVSCGATEAMMAAMLAIVDPGDEVIVFEPFYENYGPDAILSGAVPRFITLHEPDWHFDPDALATAFNDRTRAIIINTPNNPTGKIFTREELIFIADLCQKWNVTAITDEIYEHIVYEGQHLRMADLPGMAALTITISGLSKTFSATGWRIGWLIAPPEATNAIRKVHDFLTVGAAAPLQEGAAHALGFPDAYYHGLADHYRGKRDFTLALLREVGFQVYEPHGAYYIMTDIAGLSHEDDVTFARRLIAEIGVATVPGSSFYRDPERGRSKIRFCYCKKPETLEAAATLLRRLTLVDNR
ncbi:MAG TPA: aminotransferase class I/II-fold pyridoxal phosphate-dependent enzyme [Chthonomonadaceae bacterium]|nr:aminotransferase class I/II-fold pyridoxal phosphate-dependent enzyme [Chthonomonadaceae bacterium]